MMTSLNSVDYEMLNVEEFFHISRYYKKIPELIVLERIRLIKRKRCKNLFFYLRSLNILLDHFFNLEDNHPNFKDIIISFIEKIIISETLITKCSLNEIRNDYINIYPCDVKHTYNNLGIFIYNLGTLQRRNIMRKRSYNQEDCIYLLHMKLVVFY